jgi:hypothetical protein
MKEGGKENGNGEYKRPITAMNVKRRKGPNSYKGSACMCVWVGCGGYRHISI